MDDMPFWIFGDWVETIDSTIPDTNWNIKRLVRRTVLMLIRIIKSNDSSIGPLLEKHHVTLDFTIRIDSTPTFLYFDLYLNTAYSAHYVYIDSRGVFAGVGEINVL